MGCRCKRPSINRMRAPRAMSRVATRHAPDCVSRTVYAKRHVMDEAVGVAARGTGRSPRGCVWEAYRITASDSMAESASRVLTRDQIFSAMISRTVGVRKIEAGFRSARSRAARTSAPHAASRRPNSRSRGTFVRTKPAGQCQSRSFGSAAKPIGRALRMENPRSANSFGSARAMSGSPPSSRQLLVDRVDEITEFRLWGQQLVTAVHGIFVKNCCSALAKASSEAINKHANIRHEAGNPTAPHGIKPRERERRVHEVRFDAVDIGIRAVSCFASEILEESDAAFDRKHPSRRPDKPREIKCSESRSRSDVCDCRPQSDSCRSPGCVDLIAPDLVLKSKPIDFGVVRSKNIVAFPLSHGAGIPGIQV